VKALIEDDFYRQFKMNYPMVMGGAQIVELYGGVPDGLSLLWSDATAAFTPRNGPLYLGPHFGECSMTIEY